MIDDLFSPAMNAAAAPASTHDVATLASKDDDRIPLRFAAAATLQPGEALLWQEEASPPPVGALVARFRGLAVHRPGCFCCGGRGPAASALAGLFQDRARGRVPWFSGVLAAVRDPAAVAAELAGDVLVAARFRFVAGHAPNTSR